MEATPRWSNATLARFSTTFFAVGVVVAALCGFDLLGPLEPTALSVLGLATAVAIPVGIYLNRPARRTPWVLLVAAVPFLLAGDSLRQQFHTLGNLGPTRSLVPDLVVLPGYVLLALALTSLARSRDPRDRANLDMVLDGLVAALAALSVAWVYVIAPVLYAHNATMIVRITLAAYPAFDVYLILIAFRVGFDSAARRTSAWRYLIEAVLLMLVGDVLYTLADIRVLHPSPTLINLPYLLTATAVGAMVLHPSMKRLSQNKRSLPVPTEPASRLRLTIVALALFLPILAVMANRDNALSDRVVVIVIAFAATVAVTLRVFRALHASATSENRLAHQATHDALTGLPNRLVVESLVTRSLDEPSTRSSNLALVFLDIDRFKLVNDTFGHSHGDMLLIEVARRLEATVPASALVARVGGDEFVIVLHDVDNEEHVRRLAERMRLCFSAPFSVQETDVFVSASIGVAITERSSRMADAEMMIRDADTAMYQAKDAGRDTVAIFDTSMRERIADRLELEHDLRLALARRQFWLAYQPIVALVDDEVEVVGLEALLRWAHPTRGLILPDTFIGIAEDSGVIVEIGDWVIHEACRQILSWRTRPEAESLFVSVNLSAVQLAHTSLFAGVRGMLAETGLPASALCLELTESLLMDNPMEGAALLVRLKELGVRLSIDDFGTGYSSL
ncbi:MAG TPA: diguanylate cyclase, partial [Acidimicrobiales bacterium]|nr:diguanylate cyclase [Acidimicrobiales bacterium]